MKERPENVNYNAFLDDDKDYSNKNNSNLKLSREKSIFANIPKKPTQKEFKEEIKEYQKQDVGIKERIAELTVKYNSAINDSTLEENKSELHKDAEKALVKEIVNLGLQLDNDDSQPEGIGSIGLCNLLMRINFTLRDKINELAYELEKIKKNVKS